MRKDVFGEFDFDVEDFCFLAVIGHGGDPELQYICCQIHRATLMHNGKCILHLLETVVQVQVFYYDLFCQGKRILRLLVLYQSHPPLQKVAYGYVPPSITTKVREFYISWYCLQCLCTVTCLVMLH